ncbi:MAG: serine/threonine protein phosphatase [candidate division KSB1 bacterium]|nr:serine/threonine protein phosphatase [candidate division KSB1 bacterium]MDZ7318692.1 serine/threonine protein phosphatase [candidate division KSB1 bacterium]MDZ7342188.1 serine/threonine protein phosphatase [candidate division KSB1 bacterium]
MFMHKRLTRVFETAKVIPYDDSSKFICFSDCHRGDNFWADDFAPNQNLFHHALNYYYKNGFTYIELGDGDELWENKSLEDIVIAYQHIFSLLKDFYERNRLYLIWGNHDNDRGQPKYFKRKSASFGSISDPKIISLFQEIEALEGLILQHSVTGQKIFLVHGHQGDFWNDDVWRLSRLMVRYVWRKLQIFGINDPTSPAKNFRKGIQIENKIIDWAAKQQQVIIVGHTHRPSFPITSDDPPYYNDGCCIHPRSITGIEIEHNAIQLIKWCTRPNAEGLLQVTRELIAGPRSLDIYLKRSKNENH